MRPALVCHAGHPLIATARIDVQMTGAGIVGIFNDVFAQVDEGDLTCAEPTCAAPITHDVVRRACALIRVLPGELPDYVSPRVCRVCGCSDGLACQPTCDWIETDLCSTCAVLPATATVPASTTLACDVCHAPASAPHQRGCPKASAA